MFIRAGKRFNIYAPGRINGVSFSNFTDPQLQEQLGITEIADPEPPEDYTDETYFRTETDDHPYVVFTQKPPEMVAAIRWEKIKALRDELTDFGGVYVAGKWFHTDPKSKIQIIGLIMAGQSIPPSLMWKTLDGTFINMTPTLATQIFGAQLAREPQIFAVAEQKRIDNSPLNTGWPARYVPPVVVEEPEEEPDQPEES